MARGLTTSRASLVSTFDILDDETHGLDLGPGLFHRPAAPAGTREVLDELPIQICQNHPFGGADQDPCHGQRHGQDKPKHRIATLPTGSCAESKQNSRPFRQRRPPVDSETFQPLDAVQEEASSLSVDSSAEDKPLHSSLAPQESDLDDHDLLKNTIPEGSLRDQVEKHAAGQFEWLMLHPPPSDSTAHHGPHNGCTAGCEAGEMVYGCNLLFRNGRSALPSDVDHGRRSANSYILLATLLEGYANSLPEMDGLKVLADDGFTTCSQARCYPATPLKVPEMVQGVENAVSPSLTVVSDRSCSFGDGSSRTGSFSLQRIEDSLEELDRLEEEIEALDEVARPRRIPLIDDKPFQTISGTPPATETSMALKRASMACLSATVRVKSSEKTRPSLRRSASLTLRDQRHGELEHAQAKQKSKLGGTQSTTPKPSVKSTKPPTVAKFELPGEAVARRLKEQREARQARQAEAEKAAAPQPKPRANKALPKPTFELPGEAISRRKREEQEAKLRAREEEERKRREFKARPMRQSATPSALPRETIASRARQAKIQEGNAEKQTSTANKAKRFSVGPGRSAPGTPAAGDGQLTRGRNSTIVSTDEASRATSTSTGSIKGKRHSVAVEEVAQQRLRGKEIYARDNNGFMERKEREKREREMAAKAAREQAAERSRIASRGWAEKTRRKEAVA